MYPIRGIDAASHAHDHFVRVDGTAGSRSPSGHVGVEGGVGRGKDHHPAIALDTDGAILRRRDGRASWASFHGSRMIDVDDAPLELHGEESSPILTTRAGRSAPAASSCPPGRLVGRPQSWLHVLSARGLLYGLYKNGPAGHFRDGRNDVMKVKGLMAAVISVLTFVSVGCSKQVHELRPASRNPAAVGNINQSDQKRVTRADVEAARAENWWGRPVTVDQDQLIER